jgi:glycosyltransferase involved in cell wall biosynthesis
MTTATNYYDQRALQHADAIQVENPWMLEFCQQLPVSAGCDLRYAPPGVDADWFRPSASRLSSAEPYILCVARLDDPRKNINLLLEAYARLPASLIARVRLRLAGSSGPPPAFWQRAERLGLRERIEFIEKPDSAALVALYQGALAFALCSDEEGLGVVILEAMACGVPVVSTRSGGPDGIITDGQDGYLTALVDADAMAARLHTLLSDADLNAAMGKAARQTIERRYAHAVAGAAFVDTWHALLNKGAR